MSVCRFPFSFAPLPSTFPLPPDTSPGREAGFGSFLCCTLYGRGARSTVVFKIWTAPFCPLGFPLFYNLSFSFRRSLEFFFFPLRGRVLGNKHRKFFRGEFARSPLRGVARPPLFLVFNFPFLFPSLQNRRRFQLVVFHEMVWFRGPWLAVARRHSHICPRTQLDALFFLTCPAVLSSP